MRREGKGREGKGRQGKARQGKARQGKARQGKARQKVKSEKEAFKLGFPEEVKKIGVVSSHRISVRGGSLTL